MSTSPGMTVFPAPSTISAPAGTPVSARVPAATTRSPRIRITESATGSPPVPSINCAPTIATSAGSAGVVGWAPHAATAATATRTAI